MKLLEIIWNWIHLPITFLMSFPKVFRRTIGQNIFKESYNTLLGLRIMIEDDSLKWAGQYPNLIHILVLLIKLLKYFLFLTADFRYFHEIWSSLEVDKVLYFLIALLNSSLEKVIQVVVGLEMILFKVFKFMQ